MISPLLRRVCLSIKPSSLYGGASCSSITRALVLVELAVLGLGASTGMAAPSSSGIPAPAKAAPEQLKSGSAERSPQRGAPGQREARLRSRSVLRGASRAQMLQAGRSNFADVFSRRLFDGRHPDPQMAITEYQGDSGALVRDSQGRKMLLNSTMPLRARAANGAMEPVDLSLRESTQTFTTANSNADVQIFKDPARGVRFVDEGFSISPGGAASPGASVGMQSDGRVVFDDAEGSDSDVSFVVVPQPTGVEVGWLVGTDVAPETYTLKIDLPAGAHVRRTRTDHPIPGDPPRTFEIVDRDGKSLAYITPPITVDSDGVTVESSMRISGRDRLVVTVEHRGEDLHYPLFVDPQIMVQGSGGSGGWPGWETYQKPEVPTRIASDYNINYYGWALADPAYYPYGPYMSMPTRTLFDMETDRALQYRAAPDTYVIAATFGNMSHDEILSTGTYNNWWQGILNPARDTWQHLWAGNRSAFGITHSFGCCQTISPAASIQNYAIVGLGATAPSYNQYLWSGENSAALALDWANVYIDDFHPPRLDTRPSDQAWSNAPSRTLSVSGSDLGTGLLAFKLTGPDIDKTVHSTATPCHVQGGDWLPPACPAGGQTVTKDITYTPAEGTHTYTLTAIDAAGGTSGTHTWTEKIERTNPELGVSGGLFDAPTGFVTPDALDGELMGSDDLSGIKTLRLTNAAGTQLGGAAAECTADDCPDDLVANVALTPTQLPEGSSTLQLRAEDMAGNVETVDQPIKIDRTPPSAPADVAAVRQADGATGIIAWTGSADPELPTTEAGSGVVKYSYRWRRAGGVFTAWADTPDERVTTSSLSLDEAVDVEVRAVDGAGNQSTVTASTVSTVDDPGEIDLQTTDGLPPDDSSPEARSSAISRAATPPRLLVRCRVGTSAELGSTNPFVALLFAGEALIQVRAPASAYCDPNDFYGPEAVAAFNSTMVTLTVCLKVYEHTPSGSALRTLDCDTGKKRAPTYFRPLEVHAEELCRPGRVPYFTTFRFNAVSPGAPSAGGQPTGKSASVELDCNEAGAWRYRAANQPVSVPSNRLAANLKAAAADPTTADGDPLPAHGASNSRNRGWKPHHMIPAGMKHENARGIQAVRAERLGYICDIHPNAAVNGVWLRGFKLKDDQPAYNNLTQNEKDRQYHENLHTEGYFHEVADTIDPFASASGVCANESGMRSALRSLRQRMINGQMPR